MLRAAARVLGAGIVFLAAVVLGFLLHLRVPAVQRAVVARVNAILAPVFAGTLTIDRVGALGLPAVAGIDAHMDDPEGKTVIRASGIAGRASVFALLRSVVSGDIVVGIPEASLATADVSLDTDAAGTPRIANAFQPRTPSNPSAPGRGVRLSMPRVHLGHITVHGQLGTAPPLDADLDDAEGSLSVEPGKVAVDVSRGRWEARGLPGGLEARGDATGHLALPSADGADFGLHVTTQATVGGIAAQADATYDGAHVDATVDVPAASPEAVRVLLPSWPVGAPLSVHAEAHGALPQLTVRAHAALAKATLDVSGPVTLVPRLQASLHVEAKGIDARTVAPASGPPPTDLGASGDVSVVTKPDGAVTVQTALDVPAGNVDSLRTPPVSINGQLTRAAPGGEITANAKIGIHEPGAPTVVNARLVPRKGSFSLSFQVEANAPDLAQVPRLRGAARGRALAQAQGTIDLAASAVDAQLSVAGEGLAAYGSSAQAFRIQAHATGRLASPALDVEVAGEGIEVWRLQCSSLDASARVGFEGGLTLRDLELKTTASDQKVRANARYVRIGDRSVDVQDAVVKGFGAPIEGAISYVPGRLYLRARSGELHLERIARFIRVPFLHDGRIGLDVDASVGHGAADGRVNLEVSHASFGTFTDANAHVEATLKGRRGVRARHGQRRRHRLDRRAVLVRPDRRGACALHGLVASSVGRRGREGARGPAQAHRPAAGRDGSGPDSGGRLRPERPDRSRLDERRQPRRGRDGVDDGARPRRQQRIETMAHRRRRSHAPLHRRRGDRRDGARGRRARRHGAHRAGRRGVAQRPLRPDRQRRRADRRAPGDAVRRAPHVPRSLARKPPGLLRPGGRARSSARRRGVARRRRVAEGHARRDGPPRGRQHQRLRAARSTSRSRRTTTARRPTPACRR